MKLMKKPSLDLSETNSMLFEIVAQLLLLKKNDILNSFNAKGSLL